MLVLAYCGLRWGELSGLRIRDLDLDAKNPRLTVEQTVVADKGYQRIEPPKDYEHRSIPIPAFLVGLLRAQIAGRPADAPVFYGGERQGGAADAGARLGRGDARRVRRPVR